MPPGRDVHQTCDLMIRKFANLDRRPISARALAVIAALIVSSVPARGQECPTVIWSDEFEGDALDLEKWTHMSGDGCAQGICGWGNNELQSYQAENTTVSDGTLTIEARKEAVGGRQYTSSRIRTLGKGDWVYGRFEARIKLPEGQGIWPAFWMMPTDELFGGWPQSGEIDIMESVGHEPEIVHGTIHFGDPSPSNRHTGEAFRLYEGSFADGYHRFAIEKEPGLIRWFVDDVLYAVRRPADVAPHPWPFDERFHFLLNVAVGGNWPGSPDASTSFPQRLEVDYVRVYDGYLPYVVGDRLVAHAESDVTYRVGNAPSDSEITWIVPEGAKIVAGQATPTITVDWGTVSGDVEAVVSSPCGTDTLATRVLVEPAFVRDFSFEDFDTPGEVTVERTTGQFTEVPNPSPGDVNESDRSGRYVRNPSQQYDVLAYATSAIPDAGPYTAGLRKFYLDLYSTAPVGTELILQLENGSRATASYPTGRHSRYVAYTTQQQAWERLEFATLDRPDDDTPDTSIDRMVILFAPNTYTAHTYVIDNLDSYVASTGEGGEAGTAVRPDVSPLPAVLRQNYPNPFGRSTRIEYVLDRSSPVRLDVFNLLGQRVATLLDGIQGPGMHGVDFTTDDLPAGVYAYRLEAGGRAVVRVMTRW